MYRINEVIYFVPSKYDNLLLNINYRIQSVDIKLFTRISNTFCDG